MARRSRGGDLGSESTLVAGHAPRSGEPVAGDRDVAHLEPHSGFEKQHIRGLVAPRAVSMLDHTHGTKAAPRRDVHEWESEGRPMSLRPRLSRALLRRDLPIGTSRIGT